MLLAHPLILDAAVIGSERGVEELPKAYVVRKAGADIGEIDVLDWIGVKLAGYKRLTGGMYCPCLTPTFLLHELH